MGYLVKIIFLSLPDVRIAVERVQQRVEQGGHGVKEEIIQRRFHKGRKNFDEIYKTLVDCWVEYDNSGETPRFIDKGEKK